MRAAAAAALLLVSFAASGCGSGVGTTARANGDKSNGKTLFASKCAGCHTLRDANAQGKIGPDLDASFGPDRKQGFKESTIRQVVADQIRFAGDYGTKGPTMPQNLVKGQDVDDVAAYVAAVAGVTGTSVSGGTTPAQTTTAQTTTSKTSTAPSGGGADLAAGKQAFSANGCNSCHTLAAAGATGTVGPDLDKLKTYASAAGKPLEDFIHESIVDPNAYVEKGYQQGIMPPFNTLPDSTIQALVKFLAASAKS